MEELNTLFPETSSPNFFWMHCTDTDFSCFFFSGEDEGEIILSMDSLVTRRTVVLCVIW